MKTAVQEIMDNGIYHFEQLLDTNSINKLYKKMLISRNFSKSLFQSKDSYNQQTSHLKTNPSPSFNFLNEFKDDLKFIEENKTIRDLVSDLLGEDYEIVIKKAVCGVPKSWLPNWVQSKIDGVNVANLGPYIKKEYRDITYFRGIDFHQDIIDWPKGETELDPSTFLTLYVYIHDVTHRDSPLHVIPKSHKFGATLFPHNLKKIKGNLWNYENEDGKKMQCEDTILTGKAGYAAIWHNCTLHGTQPTEDESDDFRISLRYLIGKSKINKKKTKINDVNSSIEGNLKPLKTREDLNNLGKAKIKGNIINKY